MIFLIQKVLAKNPLAHNAGAKEMYGEKPGCVCVATYVGDVEIVGYISAENDEEALTKLQLKRMPPPNDFFCFPINQYKDSMTKVTSFGREADKQIGFWVRKLEEITDLSPYQK